MLTNSFVPSLLLQTLLPPLTISKSIGFSWIVALDGEKSYINLDRILDRISSVQFSRLVVSDSLQPHGRQHTRLPYPSPTPELIQTHVHRVGDAIQPSNSHHPECY